VEDAAAPQGTLAPVAHLSVVPSLPSAAAPPWPPVRVCWLSPLLRPCMYFLWRSSGTHQPWPAAGAGLPGRAGYPSMVCRECPCMHVLLWLTCACVPRLHVAHLGWWWWWGWGWWCRGTHTMLITCFAYHRLLQGPPGRGLSCPTRPAYVFVFQKHRNSQCVLCVCCLCAPVCSSCQAVGVSCAVVAARPARCCWAGRVQLCVA
jgi:hypothetical protein